MRLLDNDFEGFPVGKSSEKLNAAWSAVQRLFVAIVKGHISDNVRH